MALRFAQLTSRFRFGIVLFSSMMMLTGVTWASSVVKVGCSLRSASKALKINLSFDCAEPVVPVVVVSVSQPSRLAAGGLNKTLIEVPAVMPVLELPATTQTGELLPVNSGIDINAYLSPSWGTGDLPGPEDPNQGAFRFLCSPSHNAYDDPIVYPGQRGKAHLHTFFGNSRADANSTYASLRTTGDSTCNNLLNRSSYWMPAMMHPSGKVVMPDYISIYYKRAPAGNPACSTFGVKACLSLPRGLRYVFGYNMLDPSKDDPAWARYWNCDGPGAVSGHFATLRQAAAGCPVGARLGAVVIGPPCWNGRDVDSADHRSHMAYPQDDRMGHSICPTTHPYIVPSFQLGAWYTNDGTAANWRLSSDDMTGMRMEAGSTLHADWFGAWEDSVLASWITNCIDKARSCNGGDIGDRRQLKMLAGYDFPNGRALVAVPNR